MTNTGCTPITSFNRKTSKRCTAGRYSPTFSPSKTYKSHGNQFYFCGKYYQACLVRSHCKTTVSIKAEQIFSLLIISYNHEQTQLMIYKEC